ncbi:hypothetical protein Bca4012_083743 [Brassica carinata]
MGGVKYISLNWQNQLCKNLRPNHGFNTSTTLKKLYISYSLMYQLELAEPAVQKSEA